MPVKWRNDDGEFRVQVPARPAAVTPERGRLTRAADGLSFVTARGSPERSFMTVT